MKKNPTASSSEKKLVVYLTAGYPDIKTCLETAIEAAKNGTDIIELGVPFSDPIADGKTIQTSSHLALQKSFPSADKIPNLKKILRLASEITSRTTAEVYIMSYLNPLISYGISRLEREAAIAGIKGFIIPDLNLETAIELKKFRFPLPKNLVFMISPNSAKNISRLKKIIRHSSGFVYAVSVLGVTGTRKNLKIPVGFLKTLHNLCRKEGEKLYAGFGISTPETARRISRYTDGVIVGSAVINIMSEASKTSVPFKVGRFCAALKKAITD